MTETDAAAASPALSLEAIAPYLERAAPQLGRLEALEKFSDGQSNPTYKLLSDRGAFVLRAQPPGRLLKSAHQVDREYRVMRALAGSDAPAPRMIHLADEDSPIGRKFFVMELVEGRIFWNPALPELSSGQRAGLYDAMNRALAALHSLDPEAIGLGDFGRRTGYYQRQFKRWSEQHHASVRAPQPEVDALITALAARMPETEPPGGLVHGDWRIDNMIFSEDGSEVRAILDWELSTLGHPFADLAYQVMQWRMPNDVRPPGLAGVDRAALGLPSDAAYLADYARRRGLRDLGDWGFYLAFSFFRMVAILEGVVRRAEDGNASNPEAADAFRKAIPLLTAAGRAALSERAPEIA